MRWIYIIFKDINFSDHTSDQDFDEVIAVTTSIKKARVLCRGYKDRFIVKLELGMEYKEGTLWNKEDMEWPHLEFKFDQDEIPLKRKITIK